MNEKKYTFVSQNKITLTEKKLGWSASTEIRKKLHFLTDLVGCQRVVIDFSNLKVIHPNGIIPVISEINRLRKKGIKFELIPPSDNDIKGYAERMGYLHFTDPENYSFSQQNKYQNFSLHSFQTVDELNEVANGATCVCLQQLVFAEGVPQAFEWVLNELAGNVLVHAGVSTGWVQVLINKDLHKLTIVVCDSGVGVPHNIKSVFTEMKSDYIALEHAIKKGVTSNPEHGQGNGLAGAVAIALASEGSLYITSGKGRIKVSDGRIKSQKHFPPVEGTFIHMEFNTQKPIDLPKTLWGHNPINIFETKFEDDKGDLNFRLRDYATNFGNRPTGERLRTLLFNLLKQNPGFSISVEMADVEIIASSFADELFGKLAIELGIIDFSRYIKVVNVNPLVKSIIDVAISQRIVQTHGVKNVTLVQDFA